MQKPAFHGVPRNVYAIILLACGMAFWCGLFPVRNGCGFWSGLQLRASVFTGERKKQWRSDVVA